MTSGDPLGEHLLPDPRRRRGARARVRTPAPGSSGGEAERAEPAGRGRGRGRAHGRTHEVASARSWRRRRPTTSSQSWPSTSSRSGRWSPSPTGRCSRWPSRPRSTTSRCGVDATPPIDTAVKALAPRVKRLLQDEQNELLDAVRRQKGKGDPVDALPDEAEQVARWAEVFRPVVDELLRRRSHAGRWPHPAGARRRSSPSSWACSSCPLRERVVASLQTAVRDGPYDGLPDLQRAIAGAVGARYREWRGQDLEAALGRSRRRGRSPGACSTPPPTGRSCAGCPPRSSSAPTPTTTRSSPPARVVRSPPGQSCPPAHAGCRCLVVPAAG